MLVQPQQAATGCELDLVQHALRSWKRAQTLDPNQPSGGQGMTAHMAYSKSRVGFRGSWAIASLAALTSMLGEIYAVGVLAVTTFVVDFRPKLRAFAMVDRNSALSPWSTDAPNKQEPSTD